MGFWGFVVWFQHLNIFFCFVFFFRHTNRCFETLSFFLRKSCYFFCCWLQCLVLFRCGILLIFTGGLVFFFPIFFYSIFFFQNRGRTIVLFFFLEWCVCLLSLPLWTTRWIWIRVWNSDALLFITITDDADANAAAPAAAAAAASTTWTLVGVRNNSLSSIIFIVALQRLNVLAETERTSTSTKCCQYLNWSCQQSSSAKLTLFSNQIKISNIMAHNNKVLLSSSMA